MWKFVLIIAVFSIFKIRAEELELKDIFCKKINAYLENDCTAIGSHSMSTLAEIGDSLSKKHATGSKLGFAPGIQKIGEFFKESGASKMLYDLSEGLKMSQRRKLIEISRKALGFFMSCVKDLKKVGSSQTLINVLVKNVFPVIQPSFSNLFMAGRLVVSEFSDTDREETPDMVMDRLQMHQLLLYSDIFRQVLEVFTVEVKADEVVLEENLTVLEQVLGEYLIVGLQIALESNTENRDAVSKIKDIYDSLASVQSTYSRAWYNNPGKFFTIISSILGIAFFTNVIFLLFVN